MSARRVQVPQTIVFMFAMALAASACQPNEETAEVVAGGSGHEFGEVVLSLTNVPGDVRCLRVLVVGLDRTVRTIDPLADSLASVRVAGVPVGKSTLQVEAFEVPCAMLAPNTPATWVSAMPTPVELRPGQSLMVNVVLQRAADVRVGIEFKDSPKGVFFQTASWEVAPVVYQQKSTGPGPRLVNASSQPFAINFHLTGPQSSDFAVQPFGCVDRTVLQPGSSCSVELTFSPGAIGLRSATLDAGSNVTIALTGWGATGHGVTISPASFDAGAVQRNHRVTESFELTNGSAHPFPVAATIQSEGDFVLTGGTCRVLSKLGPGDSCTLVVEFRALLPGLRSGTLDLANIIVVPLRGSVQEMLDLRPLLGDAGSVSVGASRESLFIVENPGGPPVSLAPQVISSGGHFVRSGGNCGTTLSAGSCSIVVRFTPTAVGAYTATLSIGANLPTAVLRGTGTTAAGVTVSPPAHHFGDLPLGQQSPIATFTLSNGSAASIPVMPMTAGEDISGFQFRGTQSCVGLLAPGASCTVHLSFTPPAVGTRSALLTLTPVMAPVSLVGSGVPGGGIVALSPSHHDFGDVGLGQSASTVFTLSNKTSAALTVLPGFLGQQTEFQRDGGSCGASLAAGDSCTLGVRFAPVATSGVRTSIMSPAPGAPAATLTGTGHLTAVTISPAKPFGEVFVGASVSATLSVRNGTAAPFPLEIKLSSAVDFGFDAALTTCPPSPGSLPPGVTCTVGIRFAPTSPGQKSDTLMVSGSAAIAQLAGIGVSAWTGQDIGAVGPGGAGTFGFAPGTGVFTVNGGGADIFGTADAFFYTSKNVTGDATITARLTDLQAVDNWTKAGVMMREGPAPGARNIMLLVPALRSNQFRLQVRAATGGSTTSVAGGPATPVAWLRIVRRGNNFTALFSTDGLNFSQLGATTTLAMPPTLMVGMAVTSHVAGKTAQARFDGVTITQP